MAQRTVFVVSEFGNLFVKKVSVEMQWFPGFSFSQKQKSVQSLHESFRKIHPNGILEISTKSLDALGVKLSAFNLAIFENDRIITLEEAYQTSKVFAQHGQLKIENFNDFRALRKFTKEIDDQVIGFKYKDFEFSINPPSLFYDWLYFVFLWKNKEIRNDLLAGKYTAFTDIEFNEKRSISSQANSVALFVSLFKRNLLNAELLLPQNFIPFYKENIYKGII